MVQTLNFKEFQALPISRIFADECMPVHQETVKSLMQGYPGGLGITFCSVEKDNEEFLSQKEGDEADPDTTPVHYLYSTALAMEETEGCSFDHLTPTASFSGASGQNTKIVNTSTRRSGSCSSEGETEGSDAFSESNYEPRPDPCFMFNLRLSEH